MNQREFTGTVRRCIDDYNMISYGETVAVGVSGGKDSLSLLCALVSLRAYHPKRFDIHAVTLDMGFGNADFSQIDAFCKALNVPFTMRVSDAAKVIFEDRREKNPCSLCSSMRRGALNDMLNDLGIKKIALAHHFDDAVETFFLSLLYEGRISCFHPVMYMSRADVTQIRPMLYVREEGIVKYANREKLPIVHNACPMNGFSKREEIKELIKSLELTYPELKDRVFGGMQRMPMKGWEKPQLGLGVRI